MKYLIAGILGGMTGFLLRRAGWGFPTWQYWVVMIVMIGLFISYREVK